MSNKKPLDLRDQIAIEILNGVISNNKGDVIAQELISFISYENNSDIEKNKKMQSASAQRVEKFIRNCYKVADIVRKVRLETFA